MPTNPDWGKSTKQKLFLIEPKEDFQMKNRWLLAPSLVLSLGLTPAAFAQGMKSGGMTGGAPMEQQGDATKEKDAKKETDLMKKDSMKKDSMKDKDSMKEQGDKMGKQ